MSLKEGAVGGENEGGENKGGEKVEGGLEHEGVVISSKVGHMPVCKAVFNL